MSNKINEVNEKLDKVKMVMHNNIDVALQNCAKLENMEIKSEELLQQAGVFKTQTKELRNKLWWKNMRGKLILAFIVITIFGIITAIFVVYTKKN